MISKSTNEPPRLWVLALSLTLVFAIGMAAGWAVWGGNPAQRPPEVDSHRRIVFEETGAREAQQVQPAQAAAGASSPALHRISQALTIVDADARFVALIGALGEMNAADARAVHDRLKAEFQDKGPNREKEALFRRWGEIDPGGAIEFAKTLNDEKAQGYVLKLMVEGWARTNPAAAAQWLDRWPTVPDWEGVCAGLIKGLASNNPWAASRTAIGAIPDENNVKANWLRDSAVGTLAEAMARQGGAEQLKRWFATIPGYTPAEQKFKEKAMQTVALRLEHSDLEMAKQWLEIQPAEPWLSSQAYALVAKKLAMTDRSAALTWLASLPASPTPAVTKAAKEISSPAGKKPGAGEPQGKKRDE